VPELAVAAVNSIEAVVGRFAATVFETIFELRDAIEPGYVSRC
jgi:hypothetical protein